jgi:hypothetical protein
MLVAEREDEMVRKPGRLIKIPIKSALNVGIFCAEIKTTIGKNIMPRGDKSSYTGKQKRQADHIENSYESRGVGSKEAKRRAWATVNKSSHGGKKSGSGRGKPASNASARKGGQKGGKAKSKS